MKNIVLSFLLTILVSFLVQAEDMCATATCEQSTVNSGNVICHLMMNPSLEEGSQVLGEVLGRGAQGAVAVEKIEAENATIERGTVASAISSNNVLKRQEDGAKRFQSTEEPQLTGDRSEEENVPNLESEDALPMISEVSKYLKNEIINNIYEECLAEVAKMSQKGSGSRLAVENERKESSGAKSDIESKETLLSGAEASLNDIKEKSGTTKEASPITPMQKIAKKEIELIQKIAEEASLKAHKVELTANAIKGKMYKNDFDAEVKAYHDTEETWGEVIEGYKAALDKAHQLHCEEEELAAALVNAEAHNAIWRAHKRWVKARKEDQVIALAASLEQLKASEEAWTRAVEGYEMALEKAIKANLRTEELTTSINNAKSSRENVVKTRIEKIQSDVSENVTRITTQIEAVKKQIGESEQEEEEAQKQDNLRLQGRAKTQIWLLKELAAQLELSRDCWNKFDQFMRQGNEERASLWKKAAEESEALSEGIQKICIAPDEQKRQLLQEPWVAYCLSNASIWLMQSEEALERASQEQGNAENLWKNLAEQYKNAAYCARKIPEAFKERAQEICGDVWYCRSLYSSANYQAKSLEAQNEGKMSLAGEYQQIAETLQQIADQYRLILEIASTKKRKDITKEEMEKMKSWRELADFLQKKVAYQVRAVEAEEAGREILAVGYREAAVSYQQGVDQYKLLVETYGEITSDRSEHLTYLLNERVKCQLKAAEAQEKGKEILAGGYRVAAESYKDAAKSYQGAIESSEKEKDENGPAYIPKWKMECPIRKAEYQIKAAEAQEVGKEALAGGYRVAAETFQQAVEQNNLLFQKKAEYQVKAAEALEAGKQILALGYQVGAETYQKTADQSRLLGEICSSGEAKSYYRMEGSPYSTWESFLEEKAAYQVKVAETQEAGEKTLAVAYQDGVEAFQRAADQCKLLIEGGVEQSPSDYSWGGLNRSVRSKAGFYVKSIEVQEAGKETLAVGYREVTEIFQRAIDQYLLSFKTDVNRKESARYLAEARSLVEKASAQVKVIETQEAVK